MGATSVVEIDTQADRDTQAVFERSLQMQKVWSRDEIVNLGDLCVCLSDPPSWYYGEENFLELVKFSAFCICDYLTCSSE